MNHHKAIVSSILSAAALFVLTGPAVAAQGDWREVQTEIDSCVAAVAERANYSDATRVRHAIVDIKERTVGYKLTIETSIYTDSADSATREYATSCVVNGKHAPMIFSMSQTLDDA